MKLKIYQVDAFTSEVFGGNPAAVVPLKSWLPDEVMQSIAVENNLSETAFFIPAKDAYDLRWFTPATEVDLCGHATLASAFVLFNILAHEDRYICFHTRNEGDLGVSLEEDGRMALDFPSKPPLEASIPPGFADALGAEAESLYLNEDYLAVFSSESEVMAIKPDFKIMSKIDARGIIVTAPGDEVDFVSRFFAPRFGIDEDPVTGSAHCSLIPFWSKRLNQDKLMAHQISNRGGVLKVEDKGERVLISGQAVTYLQATITI